MATSKFISDGNKLDYTPGSAVSAGDVVVIGEIVASAPSAIAASTLGHVQIEGIIRLPKDTGSGTALTQGTKVYWDAGNQVVTTTAGANKVAGYVAKAAAAGDSTVHVKMARA